MTDFRPTRFEILPTVIKNLIIINVLVFIAQVVIDKTTEGGTLEVGMGPMSNLFALHTFQSGAFRPWQLVTHLFMHGDAMHIFFNMYALWMFGSILENVWGPPRFITFYLVCGVGAALCHMGVNYIQIESGLRNLHEVNSNLDIAQMMTLNAKIYGVTLGASGAVFGCLAAFGYLFPNTSLYIIFIPVPIKAKWFVLIYAGIELALTVRNSAGDNIAHVAHLGGALVGFLLVYFWNKTNRKRFY